MRVLALALLASCGGSSTSSPTPTAPVTTAAAVTTTTKTAPTASDTPTTAPVIPSGKLLTIAEARRYLLALVNRDRATEHLPPLELDEGPGQTSGQKHAEDMAHLGYLGHWGSDGSVPEQRLTEAGGADMVFENALCYTDEITRGVDPDPKIDPAELDKSEAQFFNEKPPNDGHRKTILRPGEKKVGIGVAQAIPQPHEKIVPCISQEFTYPYGSYDKLPLTAKIGQTVHVAGTIGNGAKFGGVGVSRVDSPKPLAVHDLNQRRHYPQPDTYQMYFPAGFTTPIPVKVDGASFSIDLPLSDHAKPGLYAVSVWGKIPGQTEHGLISFGMRTVLVK
jgi:uncharacterized protein YkwD